MRQDGDLEDTIQEAIDTCPVNCIQWVDYTELKKLEAERQYQEIPMAGFPVDRATVAAKMLFGALDEMATNWILSRRRYSLEADADAVVDLFINGARAR